MTAQRNQPLDFTVLGLNSGTSMVRNVFSSRIHPGTIVLSAACICRRRSCHTVSEAFVESVLCTGEKYCKRMQKRLFSFSTTYLPTSVLSLYIPVAPNVPAVAYILRFEIKTC